MKIRDHLLAMRVPDRDGPDARTDHTRDGLVEVCLQGFHHGTAGDRAQEPENHGVVPVAKIAARRGTGLEGGNSPGTPDPGRGQRQQLLPHLKAGRANGRRSDRGGQDGIGAGNCLPVATGGRPGGGGDDDPFEGAQSVPEPVADEALE